MVLQNQNNQSSQNLVSNINQFSEELKRSGRDPKQMVMEMLNSGKISQSDFENAKRKAESMIGFFNK